MQSIQSLINELQKDFPKLNFVESDEFLWSPTKMTVFFDPDSQYCHEYTLHELSHAILGHQNYMQDIELLKLERDAWNYARNSMAKDYNVIIDEEIVQDNLDTYRDWLYARSTCPVCETTGIEKKTQQYKCLACGHDWIANEARLCALRRYSGQTK